MEYVYLVLLQVAAFILAIVTRNVQIKVLNDSKEMTVIVYSTSVVLLILGVITFAFDTRFALGEGLFGFGMMLGTTIFLAFVFVPKVSLSNNDHVSFSQW